MPNPVAWNAHQPLQRPSGGTRDGLQRLDLRDGARVTDVKGLTSRFRRRDGTQHRLHQIMHVNELHQTASVAGNDDGAFVAQPVPEECLAIETVARPVNERRAHRHHREFVALMHAEQRPFSHRFVANVGLGMVIGRQRVTLVMIQPIAIGGHAGDINVAMQPVAGKQTRGSFHLCRGSAALPVVNVVEHGVETASGERGFEGGDVVAISLQIGHAAPEIVLRPPMQNSDAMPGLEQFVHQQPADEQRPPDH